MSYALKDILKSLSVLFISKKENIQNKEIEILDMFFHKIIITHTATRALKIFSQEHPDVIICDIELPDKNGINLLKEIKKINYSTPVIIMSKQKSEENLLETIRIQAIDFVERPIKVEKLIFALNNTAKYILNHGNITIKLSNGYVYDYIKKTILLYDGTINQLTKNEFKLLELLIANKHHALSKQEIENFLWANEQITDSAFKSLYSRLRQKIGKENIRNSVGIGYQLI